MKKFIKNIICIAVGMAAGVYWMAKKCEEELINKEERVQRQTHCVASAYRWIRAVQSNKGIRDYFARQNIKSSAVYGMGDLGKCLVQEIEKNDLEIKYIIDKNKYAQTYGYPLFSPNDDLPEVDAIIVTPAYDFENISENLRVRTNAQIISIDDIW